FLWDFVYSQIGLSADATTPPRAWTDVAVPPARPAPAFFEAVSRVLTGEQISREPSVRLRHSMGKRYRDLLRARTGSWGRVPDAVLFPCQRSEVEAILQAAGAHGVQVVPFGGGTNICGGVEPDPARAGPAVTISLRRMNRVLAVDPVART